jgi:hypothetical protein
MAFNYIGGYQNSQIIIKHPITNSVIETMTLAFPTDECLRRKIYIEYAGTVKTDLSGKEWPLIEWFRNEWILSNSNYLKGTTLVLLLKTLNYKKAGYKIILVPYLDMPYFQDEVQFTMESIEYLLTKAHLNAGGMKGTIVLFRAVNAEEQIKWEDKDSPIYMIVQKFKMYNLLS